MSHQLARPRSTKRGCLGGRQYSPPIAQTMAVLETEPMSERIAGSFRDPSGHVFRRDGRIFRAIDAECAGRLTEITESGLLPKLVETGVVVGTRPVDGGLERQLAAEHPG